MATFSTWEYYALIATLAWLGGFAPVWWDAYQRRRGVTPADAPRWRWWHAVGLALVLVPFIRMGISVYQDLTTLVVATVTGTHYVLQPIPESRLWLTVRRHLVWYLLIPAAGLLLMWDGKPARGKLARVGLAPRDGAWRDTLHGFSLVLGIVVAYVLAMLVAFVLLAEVLIATADESALWRNVTPLLILMLSAVPGVTEEFLFRGLLLTALAARMRWGWAAVLQAVAFGLIHAGYLTWAHVLGPFLFGLAMAFVVRHLGLMAAVVLHAGVNVTFFTFEVASVQPAAWLILAALIGMNAYAAYVTRLEGVKRLARAIFRRRDATAGEDGATVVHGTRRAP